MVWVLQVSLVLANIMAFAYSAIMLLFSTRQGRGEFGCW
ncbi:hypothetical protein HRbin36_02401 [bacterium HR36]|nr:hypothetical protein HRbin36_02401 [bacterium HR36]